ncbi:MAG TPA: hypothetical protein VG779_08030 [Actinomycetota bacterium]|nr:hypothetical protein [Actinomycetota bacterium]
MSLSLEDIDARIASLQAEIDTTGSSLAALDGDITLKLLASAKLSGRTAAEWNAVSPDLPLLWGSYGALKDKVAEIVALRGTKARLRIEQLEELSAQLVGDSVAVPPDPGQAGSRTLTGTPLQKTSIARLQSSMATMYRDIASVVDRVCAAWTALPRLDSLDTTLTGLVQTAGGTGIQPPAEIAQARSRIALLRTQVHADPLAADLSGVDAVARQVETATEVLRAAAAARGELAGQLTAAAQALEAIGTLIDQARAARAEASQKILGVTFGTVDADALAARLTFLRTNLQSITSVGQGDWQEARRLLGQLGQQTAALRHEVTLALGAVKGPLDTRNELRGRLDAYHAKALAIGLAEDEGLTEVYERARTLLFTAPCDVAGAEAAVREYQQGLSRPRAARGPEPA